MPLKICLSFPISHKLSSFALIHSQLHSHYEKIMSKCYITPNNPKINIKPSDINQTSAILFKIELVLNLNVIKVTEQRRKSTLSSEIIHNDCH